MKNLLLPPLTFIINNVLKMPFSYVDEVFDIKKNKRVPRWVLLLPGSGCSWAKESGGCYMCGFKTKIDRVNHGKQASTVKLMTIYRLGKLLISEESPRILTIYNGGNFFNEEEIPLSVQQEISRDVAKSPSIETLLVESRPEFITEEKIKSLTSFLNGKKLKVGIGLESVTDYVRDKCIHKGFSREDYETSVEILKANGTEILTYIFLKPLYLTEQESIEEAIKTIKYAFFIGSNEIALESAFIQEGTKMEEFYLQGKFQPPRLWSIIEVAKRTSHLGPIHIGGFEDEPPPLDVPHNCERCSERITNLFKEYNKNPDIRLLEDTYCKCKTEWMREIAHEPLTPLTEKIKEPSRQKADLCLSL